MRPLGYPAGMSTRSVTRAVAMKRTRLQTVLRYAGGSVVATVCSEVAFVLLYGPLAVGTTWSSIVSWLAGALPNYWLNRSWAWRQTGRPSMRREVMPYAAIILLTLLIATLATGAVDHALSRSALPHDARIALVAAAFLGVYVVMFVLRFLLLDRLFSRLAGPEEATIPKETGDE